MLRCGLAVDTGGLGVFWTLLLGGGRFDRLSLIGTVAAASRCTVARALTHDAGVSLAGA